jgi:hypothetical protein
LYSEFDSLKSLSTENHWCPFFSRIFLFIYFWQQWGLNSGPCVTARQVLYHLVSTSRPFFAFNYSSGRFWMFCPGLASDCDPPTYIFLGSWDHRDMPPCLVYLLGRGVFLAFLPRLALNCDPLDLRLLSRWDHRHEQPHLAIFFVGKKTCMGT